MSGNNTLESLHARLDLETAEFQRHVKQGRDEVSKLEGDLQKLGKRADEAQGFLERAGGAASMLKQAMAALAVGAAAGKLAELVTHTLDTADALGKMSQKVGVSVEDLSRLQQAAELSDVSSEQLQTALVHLAKSAVEASKGTGEQAEAFRSLGIAVTDANGRIRPTKELLDDVADAFAGMDGGAEKTSLALGVFGKAGAEILPFLNGLREASSEADRLGTVMSEKLAKDSEEVNDNLTRLKATFRGIAQEITEALMPALKAGVEQLLKLSRAYKDFAVQRSRSGTFSEDGEDRLARGRLRSAADEEADAFDADADAVAAQVERDHMREKAAYEAAELERARALAARRAGAGAFGAGDVGRLAREGALAEASAGVLDMEGGGQGDGIPDSWREMKRLEADQLEADKRVWAAEKELAQERDRAIREALERGIAVAEEYVTSSERLRMKLADLTAAYEAGEVAIDDYNRAAGELKDQLRGVDQLAAQVEDSLQAGYQERADRLRKEVEQHREMLQDAAGRISSVLAQHMVEGFRGGLRQMLADFASTLAQMAAQRAANAIVGGVFNAAFGAAFAGGAAQAPAMGPAVAPGAGGAVPVPTPTALTAGGRAPSRVDVYHRYDDLSRSITQQQALERVIADEMARR